MKIPLFKISTRIIEDETIGNFYTIKRKNNSHVQDLLKIEDKEFVELDYCPKHLAVLSNNRLLILNYLNFSDSDPAECITIHDENYNLIQKVDTINGQKFSHIREIAINEEKRELYLPDYTHHRIIVMDFELNFIKYFGSFGLHGSYKFNKPLGTCFKNEYFYVCDSNNKRIQIFDKDLVFVNSIKTNYSAIRIQASNSVLVVVAENRIYFYDLNSLEIRYKFKHDLKLGFPLSVIDSRFYGFDHNNKKFLCFDQKGNLMEKINMNEYDLSSFFCDGNLIIFNQKLLMNSSQKKQLIIFR